MAYYSADPERGSRKIDALPHPDDEYCVVLITTGVDAWFAIKAHDPLDRIIQALTASAAYHAELWIDTSLAAPATTELAESKLGMPYDFEGALLSWKESGKHTIGEEFCSGMAFEILTPILQGLAPYPCPGLLLSQVTGMVNQPMSKLAVPPSHVSDDDLAWLQSQVPHAIATGTFQEVVACLA